MSIKRLIVVCGATASGKSALAVRLAQHYGAPIISTDSRQFYRGLAIGTAQPIAEELQAAEHHFIASHELAEPLNCGEYETMAIERLEELFAHHDYVVAVGGSGLYINALCYGMDELPKHDAELRASLNKRLEVEGLEPLLAQLKELDPAYYEVVDRQNPARIVRALEVCLQTGMPYSVQRTGERKARPFEVVKVAIDMPREVLYERIDRRVDAMISDGLEAEARAVYPFRHLNSLQTVGYREMFDYFDGEIDFERAVELIKRNSRRYAKRQITWFGRDEDVHWFKFGDEKSIIAHIDFGK